MFPCVWKKHFSLPVPVLGFWRMPRYGDGSARQHLRLALEAGHASVIFGKVGRKDFDRNVAIELGIGGAIYRAHAAFAEFGDDPVGLIR